MGFDFLPVKRRKKRDPRKKLSLQVPPKMKALLRKVAHREGTDVAVIVRKYIRDGLREDGLVF